MSGGIGHQQVPRAMIHKRIIDAAAARPKAALAEIAGDVPGASTDLVERVLDEYGDPADDEQDHVPTASKSTANESTGASLTVTPDHTGTDDTSPTDTVVPEATEKESAEQPTEERTVRAAGALEAKGSEGRSEDEPSNGDEPQIDVNSLTEKRRETLRAINAYPGASQRELAEKLGVAAATISQRVSAIDGFEWDDRAAFVSGLFDETRAAFDAEFGLCDAPSALEDTENSPAESARGDTLLAESASTAYETASDGGRFNGEHQLVALTERVAALESILERRDTSPKEPDSELLSKILHACINADSISTEEEHEIIELLVE